MSFSSLELSKNLIKSVQNVVEGKNPSEQEKVFDDKDKEENKKKKDKNDKSDEEKLNNPKKEKITINPKMNEKLEENKLYSYPNDRSNPPSAVDNYKDPFEKQRGRWTTTSDNEHHHEFYFGDSYTFSSHGHTHQIKYDEKGNPVILSGGVKSHTHKVSKKIDESMKNENTKDINEKFSLEGSIRNIMSKK